MTTPTFDSLMQIAHLQSFPPQLELIRQGGYADFLHIIIEGSVELRASWNDREAVMEILHPVSTFILAACVYDEPYLMSARTLVQSQIVRDTRRGCARGAAERQRLRHGGDARTGRRLPHIRALRQEPEAAQFIGTARHLCPASVRSVRPRRRHHAARGERHLASYLWMTPENLSRSMRALQGHGATVQGMRVTITDRERVWRRLQCSIL